MWTEIVGMLFEVCPNMIRSGCLILMCVEALTVSISTNSIEEADETYFPTVKELVSSFTKGGLPEDGLSEKPAQQTVDELAMEKSSHFSSPNKSAPGGNMYGSQGGRI
jgi:hypothetical protein